MKIYTKKGDKGLTTILGGKQVLKSHERVEAYGTIDELIAHIALLHDIAMQPDVKEKCMKIEEMLMVCAALVASEDSVANPTLPQLHEEDVEWLESEIDSMQQSLPELHSFVLPGGNIASSQCQVARTVCRRAERLVNLPGLQASLPEILLVYMNRLSDYLFVLARKLLYDSGEKEILWETNL